ncbi:MAG: toll/interleukin-1 receptor domain-containing protein [Hyphomicrobiales bacterium]
MAKLWITYAWKDNEQSDVDFVVQQLKRAGMDVQIDRFALGAGRRLWEQIGAKITNPNESDAWAIYATENSLASEPCKEELAIALDRALCARGEAYPLIGIFPASVATDLIPPAIRVRLYVSLRDPDWIERVKAAVERRAPAIRQDILPPLFHRIFSTPKQFVVEARPRVGRWYPIYILIPMPEVNRLAAALVGPSGAVPSAGMTAQSESQTQDGKWKAIILSHEATPGQSVYVVFNQLPSALGIGPKEHPYEVRLEKRDLA